MRTSAHTFLYISIHLHTSASLHHLLTSSLYIWRYIFSLKEELMSSLCIAYVQLMSESGHKLLIIFI